MNAKFLTSLGAAVTLTSLAHAAIAETLGEHPAVRVARTWSSRGIDPNTFIVLHPAGPVWVDASPTAKQKATREVTTRAATATSASGK
jgi:hypothetical protein